ncbi:translation initiation factor IF-3 [Changpingibacter yushuensis]|uniref:translation initiation factor IF-3 n=1 Tax=Changpingibacter yushuensis TaxID=2758440 RepID=UPI001FE68C0B
MHVEQVRLVGPGGEQVGVVRVEDALRLAQESGLDLVEVAPDANPPVAKLMDYGKFKYESAQKAREARRNQSNTVIKSIRIGLKIDENDYNTKKGQAERFLTGGDKVKFDLRFKGREQSRPEMGVKLLRGIAEELSEISTIEAAPRAEGRNMSMVLAPLRKKSEAKSDQRRRREAERDQRRVRDVERVQRTVSDGEDIESSEPAEVAATPASAPARPTPATPRPAPRPGAPRAN